MAAAANAENRQRLVCIVEDTGMPDHTRPNLTVNTPYRQALPRMRADDMRTFSHRDRKHE
jgi:hypothetical protein